MQQEQQYGDRIHLVDAESIKEKKLDSDKIDKFFKQNNFYQFGKNYNIVSIIGSQSTGKSTLLNKIFGTAFDVQQRNQSLGQTTVGIWLSRDKTDPVIVLDVEGSDSVERKTTEGDQNLGNYTTCQLNIIEIIMQMNLKLFQQDTIKNIVFVIRDWDEEASYKDAKQKINKYLLDIWEQIPKVNQKLNLFKILKQPENMQNVKFYDLFTLSVETLCYYKMKEFGEECNKIRRKLVDSNNPDYYLKQFDYERNLPLDALPVYLANIWETISYNKDLNLPNEKVLVSNMRCQQIKQDCMEMIKQDLEDIQNAVQVGYYEKFGEKGKNSLNKAITTFTKETRDYAKDVVQEKKEELNSEILARLYVNFQKQVTQIKTFISAEFENVLEQLKGISQIQELPGQLKIIKEQIPENLHSRLQNSIIVENLWNESEFEDTFIKQIQSQINQFLEHQIIQYNQKLDKQIKVECDRLVGGQVSQVSNDFWENIQIQYDEMFKAKFSEFDKLLQDLEIQDKSRSRYLEKLEKESQESLDNSIKQQSQRFQQSLFQKFKQLFIRDEKGEPRNWKKLTEEEIFHFYNESKDQVFLLIEVLKVSKLKFASLARQNSSIESSIFKSNMLQTSKTIEERDSTILNEAQVVQLRNNLLEEFETSYQDAIQKHKQDFLQNIPKWFWFMLLFFMYDDVLRWMGNPYFLYPILMIICFVGFCIAIGRTFIILLQCNARISLATKSTFYASCFSVQFLVRASSFFKVEKQLNFNMESLIVILLTNQSLYVQQNLNKIHVSITNIFRQFKNKNTQQHLKNDVLIIKYFYNLINKNCNQTMYKKHYQKQKRRARCRKFVFLVILIVLAFKGWQYANSYLDSLEGSNQFNKDQCNNNEYVYENFLNQNVNPLAFQINDIQKHQEIDRSTSQEELNEGPGIFTFFYKILGFIWWILSYVIYYGYQFGFAVGMGFITFVNAESRLCSYIKSSHNNQTITKKNKNHVERSQRNILQYTLELLGITLLIHMLNHYFIFIDMLREGVHLAQPAILVTALIQCTKDTHLLQYWSNSTDPMMMVHFVFLYLMFSFFKMILDNILFLSVGSDELQQLQEI